MEKLLAGRTLQKLLLLKNTFLLLQKLLPNILVMVALPLLKKKGLNPQQTIRLIENAGGIAVLAHPYKSGIEESFIPEFVEWGIQGIETYTPAQKGNIGKRYRDIAKRFNLVETGGSDFHAPHGTTLPNCMKMPYTAVTELKERKEKSRAEWF